MMVKKLHVIGTRVGGNLSRAVYMTRLVILNPLYFISRWFK